MLRKDNVFPLVGSSEFHCPAQTIATGAHSFGLFNTVDVYEKTTVRHVASCEWEMNFLDIKPREKLEPRLIP